MAVAASLLYAALAAAVTFQEMRLTLHARQMPPMFLAHSGRRSTKR
jgi:hypothetical protein